jgi:hypothetical protein
VVIQVSFQPEAAMQRWYSYLWMGDKNVSVGDVVLVPQRDSDEMREATVMSLEAGKFSGQLATIDKRA